MTPEWIMGNMYGVPSGLGRKLNYFEYCPLDSLVISEQCVSKVTWNNFISGPNPEVNPCREWR